MPSNEEYEAILREALARAGVHAELRALRMFGGLGMYADGAIFAQGSNLGLALKLAPADQDALLAIAGATRLQYETDPSPSRQYILVPPGYLDDADSLGPWARRSVDFARAAKNAPKKARGGKKG